MATFSKFLNSIYRDGNDGKAFERFVKWFLTHDPEWKTQVDKVWLWEDWAGGRVWLYNFAREFSPSPAFSFWASLQLAGP